MDEKGTHFLFYTTAYYLHSLFTKSLLDTFWITKGSLIIVPSKQSRLKAYFNKMFSVYISQMMRKMRNKFPFRVVMYCINYLKANVYFNDAAVINDFYAYVKVYIRLLFVSIGSSNGKYSTEPSLIGMYTNQLDFLTSIIYRFFLVIAFKIKCDCEISIAFESSCLCMWMLDACYSVECSIIKKYFCEIAWISSNRN